MSQPLQRLVRRPSVQKALHRVLAGGSTQLTRRQAAFLFDLGTNWQPAGFAKRRHLLDLFERRGHRTLIESGTYEGDTVAAFLGKADAIVSVELEPGLAEKASRRFAGESSVRIVQGDGTDAIPPAVAAADGPPLVWLDSHFSGGVTALGEEVEPAVAILSELGAVAPTGTTIVVDDLRLFGVEPGFPGLDELVAAGRASFPSAVIRVGLDSLVIEA